MLSKGKMLGIATISLFVVVGLVTAFSMVGYYNSFQAQELGLEAEYKNNQVIFDSFWKKVKETAQVPDMYTNDLKKLYDGAMHGRYGSDGSKAVFQFITEQNPNIDPQMYIQIQRIIESGRNDFSASQKTLLDKKRVYETNLNTFPGNIAAALFHFPRKDLKQFDIISSDETAHAFETKKSEPLQLRP